MKVTVKESKEKEIDWNESQLVVSKTEINYIVQISRDQSKTSGNELFSGQRLSTGEFSANWKKSAFKKFKGTITIEQ